MTSSTGHQRLSEPWPDGVAARYVTVGGATVDITVEYAGRTGAELMARCGGCGDQDMVYVNSKGRPESEDAMRDAALRDARPWAQAHAERCRALPNAKTGEGDHDGEV